MNKYSIEIKPTNNDSIKKFEANSFLVKGEGYEFRNIEEAKDSPIAQQLFHLPFVKTVYISQNFIAIEKFNIIGWPEIENEVAEQVQEYLNSGKEVVKSSAESQKNIPVTVYAESTPNPKVMKFVANKKLVKMLVWEQLSIMIAMVGFPYKGFMPLLRIIYYFQETE